MAKRIDDEAFVDEELTSRIDWIIDDVLLHDASWREWEHDIDAQERRHLSELGRICQNFTQSDFAAICIVAFENYPMMYMQIAAEGIQQMKGESNGKH